MAKSSKMSFITFGVADRPKYMNNFSLKIYVEKSLMCIRVVNMFRVIIKMLETENYG